MFKDIAAAMARIGSEGEASGLIAPLRIPISLRTASLAKRAERSQDMVYWD